MHHLEELVRNGDVGDDEERRAEERVQKLTDDHVAKIDDLLKRKEVDREVCASGRSVSLLTRLRTLELLSCCTRRGPGRRAAIAIIMDGNGRWARRRRLPVLLPATGAGTRALRRTVEAAIDSVSIRSASTLSRPRTGRARPTRSMR